MSPLDRLLDGDGRPLPFDPRDGPGITQRLLDAGELVAVIVRLPDGGIGVSLITDIPPAEILDILDRCRAAFARASAGE